MTADHDDDARAVAPQGQSAAALTAWLAVRTLTDRAQRSDDQGDDWATSPPADQTPQPTDERSERYDGPLVRADSLDLRAVQLSELTDDISPPNLLVVGGSARNAWAIAERVQKIRRGALRAIEMDGLSPSDLAAIVTSLDERDVLLIPSVDGARTDTLGVLDGLLTLWPEGSHVEAGARALDVMIGKGPTARSLTLTIRPFFFVVRTWSGKVPERLRDWGAQVIVSVDTKLCRWCAEEIKAAAIVCRFCGRETRP